MGSICSDDRVEVSVDSDPARPIAGKVTYIGEIVDEQTRSVQVMITCPNRDRRLKPGMFASVRFSGAPRQVVLIPATALQQGESESYVFVRAGEGIYLRREVQAVSAGPGEAVVTRGLEPGEVIVTRGGILLMGE
ncbi:hypothetical protein FACS1894159_11880 [Bacteroidia bacterium]|nr:hypothetical protein FACS1894159_11880 [Bacteroidia bacterium]